ncbi:MAG: class I SAM-dependent methyltransferase [Candidatus Acidiferrales bacterium]
MSTPATQLDHTHERNGQAIGGDELTIALRRLRTRSSDEFVAALDERKRQERQWANFSRDEQGAQAREGTNEKRRANYKWYATTEVSMDYRDRWLAEHVPGKVFLDYACGNGAETIKAARMGAAVAIGIDVSNVSVGNGAAAASREGFDDRCVFIEGDCENTGLPANSVDVILCSYMLHHLDLTHAYPELHRVLKPGGCILGSEALNYNPLIRLYRKLTPELRTEWEKEHILSLKDVRAAKQYFNVGDIRYWHLTSVFGVFVRGIPPVFRAVMPVLNGLDRFLLAVPGVQLMAWQFSFELFKPVE